MSKNNEKKRVRNITLRFIREFDLNKLEKKYLDNLNIKKKILQLLKKISEISIKIV